MILTLQGGPGAGKTSIARILIDAHGMQRVPSITTKSPQIEHHDRGEYIYMSQSRFNAEQFLWKGTSRNIQYGTRERDVQEALNAPEWRIMVLMPEFTELLYMYAQSLEQEDQIRSFLLWSTPETITRRISTRNISDNDKAAEMRRYLNFLAATFVGHPNTNVIGIPNHDDTIELTIATILRNL